DKFHIRHLMLCEFRKHKATNAINAVYPGVLDARTRQRWFKKFTDGDFNLSDGVNSKRPVYFYFKNIPIRQKGNRKFVREIKTVLTLKLNKILYRKTTLLVGVPNNLTNSS
ncbi:hypothetical protein WN51_02445, partial [Melipona quadrifasciata]